MFEWEKFEDFVRHLTIEDGTKRTPLSGATKQEEDVVGNTLICQCKQTEDKNFSILEKDVTRLLGSAKLLEKFPLFFSSSKAGQVMSIPINKDTEDTVNMLIMSIIVKRRLMVLHNFCKNIKDEIALLRAKRELQGVALAANELAQTNKKLLERIQSQIDYAYDDLTMYNLFDEKENEPKKD